MATLEEEVFYNRQLINQLVSQSKTIAELIESVDGLVDEDLLAIRRASDATTRYIKYSTLISSLPLGSVEEYDGIVNFPITGSSNKIYIDSLLNTIYRWDSLALDYSYLGGDSNPPIENIYADIAALQADQGNQTLNFVQEVIDASADPTITSGKGYYIYKGTTTGLLTTDYRKLTQSEYEAIRQVSETSNKVITLSLQDIGATDFEDDVKTKMLAYLQSEGVTIESGVMPVIELNDVEYNFKIKADWTANSVTDEASFVTFMDGRQDGSGVTVTDFILDGDWIRCNLSNSDADGLTLFSSNIKKVISIGEWISLTVLDLSSNSLTEFSSSIELPSGLNGFDLNSNQLTEFNPSIALPSSLTRLNLISNQLTEFNPSIALPSSLTSLYLNGNQLTEFNPSIALPVSLMILYLDNNLLTTTSYTNAETWATAQPAFTSICNIYFSNNTDSIAGTNLESILSTKNVIIYF